MPGGYRRPAAPGIPMTESQWLNWPMAQTGIQSHATCQGVAALNTEANILAVQSNDTDPFWNYVPLQKTSSGLGDEPEQWIPVVLSGDRREPHELGTAAEFRTACEGDRRRLRRPPTRRRTRPAVRSPRPWRPRSPPSTP